MAGLGTALTGGIAAIGRSGWFDEVWGRTRGVLTQVPQRGRLVPGSQGGDISPSPSMRLGGFIGP
jgi:hypothetical protein